MHAHARRGRLSLHPFAGASEVHSNILSVKWRHQSRQHGFTRMYNGGMHGGWAPLAQGQGFKVKTAGENEPLLVFLVLLALFIIGFGTGKTHVTFIDAIFAEILVT